jgi:uncharacterized metal-binding protein YceD (DUF177 family)
MKIPFQNIGSQPKSVNRTLEGEDFNVALDGSLTRKGLGMARLNGDLKGSIQLICDRCGEPFVYHVDEKVTLKITDAPHKSSEGLGDEQDYDIIEFLDGIIDLDEIIISEVNAIKFDYHKCENCN